MKGVLQPDHMPTNNFKLSLVELPVDLTPTEVSGLEEELEVVELPDRTKASGGHTKATEFTIKLPMHHTAEQAAMEAWYAGSQDGGLPVYKYNGALQHRSNHGGATRVYSLIGVFPTKRTLPDLEMASEGDMAVVEWTLSVDQLLPI